MEKGYLARGKAALLVHQNAWTAFSGLAAAVAAVRTPPQQYVVADGTPAKQPVTGASGRDKQDQQGDDNDDFSGHGCSPEVKMRYRVDPAETRFRPRGIFGAGMFSSQANRP